MVNDGTIQFEDCEEQSVPSDSKRLTHEANGSAGNLGYIFNGDWVAFNDINLGEGKSRVDIYSGAKNNNATIVKFYLDEIDDTPEATVTCPATGNWSKYETFFPRAFFTSTEGVLFKYNSCPSR